MRFRGDNEIDAVTTAFLARYHPCGSIPIPIEFIVEDILGMEIVPVKGLKSKYRVEGFISMDLQTITVDQDQMQQFPNRYRFTLAHEVGHRELHANMISYQMGTTVAEWRTNTAAISPGLHRRLEYQAYCFAGRLLVPTTSLKERVGGMQDRWSNANITQKFFLKQGLAKTFDVSDQVMQRRLDKEGLLMMENVMTSA